MGAHRAVFPGDAAGGIARDLRGRSAHLPSFWASRARDEPVDALTSNRSVALISNEFPRILRYPRLRNDPRLRNLCPVPQRRPSSRLGQQDWGELELFLLLAEDLLQLHSGFPTHFSILTRPPGKAGAV